MADLEIRFSRGKLALIAIGALALMACAIPAVASGLKDGGGSLVFTVAFSVVDVLFFGWALVFAIRRLFVCPIAIRLTERGIEDRSSAIGFDCLPWSEVGRVGITSTFNQTFVAVWPKDVEGFLASQPSRVAKAMRANMFIAGSPINISTNGLAISHKDLLEAVTQYFDRYGPAAETNQHYFHPAQNLP